MSDPKALRTYPPGVIGRPQRERPAITLAELVVAEYPDPRPFESAEQLARLYHDDLMSLPDEDLDRERGRATMRFLYGDRLSDWFRERRARLEAESLRRQQVKRRARS